MSYIKGQVGDLGAGHAFMSFEHLARDREPTALMHSGGLLPSTLRGSFTVRQGHRVDGLFHQCCCFGQRPAVAVQALQGQFAFASPQLFAALLCKKFTLPSNKFCALRRCSSVVFLYCKCARGSCKKKRQTVRNSLPCVMEARAGVEPTYTDLQSGA